MKRTLPFVRLAAAFTFLLAAGLFGCQGCQSGIGTSRDLGGPEDRNPAAETPDGDGAGEKRDPTPGASPAGPPEAGPGAQALAEKLDFIDIELLRVQRDIFSSGGAQRSREEALEKILEEFERKRAEAPKDARILYLVGFLDFLMDRPDKALERFEAAQTADPGLLIPWKGVALVHAKKKDEAKAQEALDKLRAPGVPEPFGLLLLADFFQEVGRSEEALAVLRRATETAPASPRPWRKLAELWGGEEKWEEAFNALDQAISRDARNQAVWIIKAQIHFRRAQVEAEMVQEGRGGPGSRDVIENHRRLCEDALEQCVKIDASSLLGSMASSFLERMRDPGKILRDLVEDASADAKKRLAALLQLVALGVRQTPLPFWIETVRLPDKDLSKVAAQALGQYGGEEALKVLLDLLMDDSKDCFERANLPPLLQSVHRREPRTFGAEGLDVVGSLLAAMRLCRGRVEAKGDEAYVFKDILKLLARITGKNFGEWRSNTTQADMDETLKEWDAWRGGGGK